MAVPIEYFTEQLKSMQLCQMEGKVTDFWQEKFPENCLHDGVIEINNLLFQAKMINQVCMIDILEDAFSEKYLQELLQKSHKILIEENTGKIIQIREEFYLPNDIEIEKIPLCDTEKIPQKHIKSLQEKIVTNNLTELENIKISIQKEKEISFFEKFSADYNEIIWIFSFIISILIILRIIKIGIEKIFKKKS